MQRFNSRQQKPPTEFSAMAACGAWAALAWGKLYQDSHRRMHVEPQIFNSLWSSSYKLWNSSTTFCLLVSPQDAHLDHCCLPDLVVLAIFLCHRG